MDGYLSNAKAFSEAASEDDRFRWLARLDYDDVDLNGLETCLEAGASGDHPYDRPTTPVDFVSNHCGNPVAIVFTPLHV